MLKFFNRRRLKKIGISRYRPRIAVFRTKNFDSSLIVRMLVVIDLVSDLFGPFCAH